MVHSLIPRKFYVRDSLIHHATIAYGYLTESMSAWCVQLRIPHHTHVRVSHVSPICTRIRAMKKQEVNTGFNKRLTHLQGVGTILLALAAFLCALWCVMVVVRFVAGLLVGPA